MRPANPSELAGLTGFDRKTRIDLGLAIAEHHATAGVPMTYDALAAFCGCSRAMIYSIERDALKKIRTRFLFQHNRDLRELNDHFTARRRVA